jgi:eukaryotic-like serine/threonine-protein kinase
MSEPAAVIKRICPSCDAEATPTGVEPVCPTCGSRLIEVRPPVDNLIGQVIDERFEIRARLGEGGMGTVYRAWQRSIGREVAIKLIDERFAGDAMSVRRFLREARLSSQLSQPNTVSVIDFGQSKDGRLFIAMELVRGRTLADVMKDAGPFSVSRAARIGVQLCDALDAAHRLNIVHRDLKPANIIILDDPPGRDLVKVLDFGLAKSLTDDETEATQAGLVVGTPRYMAPELATGGKPGAATDLYAVGVILAELVAGKHLWEGALTDQLLAAKALGAPLKSELPAQLLPLVEQLMAANPAKRPNAASDVRAQLLAMIESGEGAIALPRPDGSKTPAPLDLTTPERRRPAPPPSSRKIVVAIGGVVLLALVLTAGAMNLPTTAPPAQPRPTAPVARPVTPAVPPEPVVSAPVEPDLPAQVRLHVTSRPAGASLSVDGRSSGKTPTEIEVARGVPVTVTLTLAGRSLTRTVVPERDQDLVLVMPGGATTQSGGQPNGDALPF